MKDIINEQITRMKNIRKKNSRVAMIITMFALMVAMGVSWKMKIIGISMTEDASTETFVTKEVTRVGYLSTVSRLPQAGDSIYLDTKDIRWFTNGKNNDSHSFARMYYNIDSSEKTSYDDINGIIGYDSDGTPYIDCEVKNANGLWQFELPSDFDNTKMVCFTRRDSAGGTYTPSNVLSLVVGSNKANFGTDKYQGQFISEWISDYEKTTLYIDTASFGNITSATVTTENGESYSITDLTPKKNALVFNILDSYQIKKSTNLTLNYGSGSVTFNLSNLTSNYIKLDNGNLVSNATDYSFGRKIYFDATYSQLKYEENDYLLDKSYYKDILKTTPIEHHLNTIPFYGSNNNSRQTMLCKAYDSNNQSVVFEMTPVSGYDSYDGQLIYVTNSDVDPKYTEFEFYSEGTENWNNSANTKKSGPDNDDTKNCFIADTSDISIYMDTEKRDGYWGTFDESTNTPQKKDAEKDKNQTIVDLGEGTKYQKYQNSDVLWVQSSMYDYYTDYELNGNNRDKYSYNESTNSYEVIKDVNGEEKEESGIERRYMPFRQFNQALSNKYQASSITYPIYTGHFQPHAEKLIGDDGHLFGYPYFERNNSNEDDNFHPSLATVLNLYGQNDMYNFLSINNSILDRNGVNKDEKPYGYYDYATVGLVNDSFNDKGYPTLKGSTLIDPHFDEDFLNGNNSKNAVLGKVYENVAFPFTKRNYVFKNEPVEYWWFDSASTSLELKKDTSVDNGYYLDGSLGKKTDSLNLESTGNPLPENAESNVNNIRNKYGFFPLNRGVEKSHSSLYNYGFGNKITINFKLNKDGTVEGTDGKFYPSRFRFSGDDDVWIFIDGKLVLDCGGDHGYVAGLIDFSQNNSYVTKVKDAASTTQNYDTASKYNNPEDLVYEPSGENANRPITDKYYYSSSNVISGEQPKSYDTTKTHEMVIYYMERGQWESNLSLAFSMNVSDKVEVGKNVDATNVNDLFKDYFNDDLAFDFNVKNLATHFGKYNEELLGGDTSDISYAKSFAGTIGFGNNIQTGNGALQTDGKISDYRGYYDVIKWTATDSASDDTTRNNRLITFTSDSESSIDITNRNILSFDAATENGDEDSIYIVVEDESGNRATGHLTSDVCTGSIATTNTWYSLSVNLTKLDNYNQLDKTHIKYIGVENDIQTYTFFDNFVFKTAALLGAGSQKAIRDYGSAESGTLMNASGAVYNEEDIVKTSSSTVKTGSVGENGNLTLTSGKKAVFTDQFRKGSYLQVNEVLNEAQAALFDTKVKVQNNGVNITDGYTYSSPSKTVIKSTGGSFTQSKISDGSNTLIGIDDGRIEKILEKVGTETGANESKYSIEGIEAKPADANTIVVRSYELPDGESSNVTISMNYTNVVRTGGLKIEKAELDYAPLKIGGKYTFTIKFSNIGGVGLKTKDDKTEETVVVVATKTSDGFKYTVDGKSVEGIPLITGIPVGTKYTVTETTSDGTGIVGNNKTVTNSNGEEVSSERVELSENSFSGEITYDETLSTGNTDKYTVVNSKKPTTSLDIQKLWKSDEDKSRPDSVYVKLQVSKDDGTTWTDVEDGIYVLNKVENYKKTIDNLDVFDDYNSPDRKHLMYRIVECIKNGDTYYEVDNTTYKINNYKYEPGKVITADENAEDGNSGTATAINNYVKQYNLPKTGSFGADKLIYGGLAIIMLDCMYYIFLSRRKKEERRRG